MTRASEPAALPEWLRVYERFIPEEPPKHFDNPGAPEYLGEMREGEKLPERPFAFAWFMISRHGMKRAIGLALTILVIVAIEGASPWFVNQLVTQLTAGNTWSVVGWMAALAIVWIQSDLGARVYDFQWIYFGPRMRTLTQKYLFQHMLGHSPSYFEDNFAGRLAQKIRTAGDSMTQVTGLLLRDFNHVCVLLLTGLVFLSLTAPIFAGILAAWAVAYIGIAAYLGRHCSTLAHSLSDRWSTVTGKLVDSISNADAVRAFAKTDHERRYVSHYLFRGMTGSMRIQWFLLMMRSIQGAAMWILRIAMVSVAVWQVLAGSLTIGGFTMIFLYVIMFSTHLRHLTFQILDFFEYLGNLSEALEIINVPHEITDAPEASPLAVHKGEIRFENVGFSHEDTTGVFEGLNLTIRPGEKIGLVGRSGAGKSTLIRLLRRQYEPQHGHIYIDGQDVSTVSWASLNEAVAEVPQVPAIFHRTVRDNIRYARPTASEEEVLHAAHKAHAHDFIMSRETGYDTVVGEQGIKLSGGERQRVAIARAFIKDARILVLDEATSALDSESEQHIQEALFDLMKGRTVIAIAHRLSTITGMDRIIVLDKGQIIEEGTHEALLAKGGTYAALWNHQAGGFVQDVA